MSRLIKRGMSVNGGIRPINYGAETLGAPKSDLDNTTKSDSKIAESKIAEEIKTQAYRDAMIQAERDIAILIEEKKAELEVEVLREMEQMQKKHAAKLARIEEIASAIESKGKEYITNLEPFVVTLTMHALHKLVGKKEIFEELMKGIIAHAISDLATNEMVTVTLSEQDKQFFSIEGDSVEDKLEKIIFDDSLPSGACMVESGNTTIDASLYNALNSIQSALDTRKQ